MSSHKQNGTGLFPKLETAGQGATGGDAERDRLLDAATASGKFPKSRRAHYAARYDRDPAATRKLINQLAAAPELVAGASSRTGLFPKLD